MLHPMLNNVECSSCSWTVTEREGTIANIKHHPIKVIQSGHLKGICPKCKKQYKVNMISGNDFYLLRVKEITNAY